MRARGLDPSSYFERRLERVELGTYGTGSLSGLVRHSSVRLASRSPGGWQLTFGRARPAYIEVVASGQQTTLEVPRPPDPWLVVVIGLLLLVLVSVLATRVGR